MKTGVASAGVVMALICCISAWGRRHGSPNPEQHPGVGRDFAAMFPYFQNWLDSGESSSCCRRRDQRYAGYKRQEDADGAASLWRSLRAPAPSGYKCVSLMPILTLGTSSQFRRLACSCARG